jgi:tagatose-6-phosphate ketose/aldose isomerase
LQGAARESALKVLELTAGKLAAFYDSPTGFRHGPKSLVDSETLVVVFVSSHPYTRQYDLDLLAELRRDRQAMRVVAIAAETIRSLKRARTSCCRLHVRLSIWNRRSAS